MCCWLKVVVVPPREVPRKVAVLCGRGATGEWIERFPTGPIMVSPNASRSSSPATAATASKMVVTGETPRLTMGLELLLVSGKLEAGRRSCEAAAESDSLLFLEAFNRVVIGEDDGDADGDAPLRVVVVIPPLC